MGVKHKKLKETRDLFIRFRATKAEHDEIMEQARSRGYNSFSDYIRKLIQQDIENSKVTDLLTCTVGEAISQQYNK